MLPLVFISKKINSLLAIFCMVLTIVSCASSDDEDSANEDVSAPIAPPAAIGTPEKNSQFARIPGADRNNVELVLPYNALSNADRQRLNENDRRREAAARQTDREVAGEAGDNNGSKSLGDLDRQLGVEGQTGDIGNAPSFTLGTQKIKELFKEKKFEDALIETNELLKHYPRSAQLLLMKGTLHQRLGQIDLALASYERSFEFEPSRKLQAQITNLKRKVQERESLRRQREGVVKPGGTVKIETVPSKPTK